MLLRMRTYLVSAQSGLSFLTSTNETLEQCVECLELMIKTPE